MCVIVVSMGLVSVASLEISDAAYNGHYWKINQNDTNFKIYMNGYTCVYNRSHLKMYSQMQCYYYQYIASNGNMKKYLVINASATYTMDFRNVGQYIKITSKKCGMDGHNTTTVKQVRYRYSAYDYYMHRHNNFRKQQFDGLLKRE
jgi:hypothetical protein